MYNNLILLITCLFIGNLTTINLNKNADISIFNNEFNKDASKNSTIKLNDKIIINPDSQDINKFIIGTWQRDDSVITDGLQDIFRFYRNNHFNFNISQYKWDNPIKELTGDYKLKKGNIIIILKAIIYFDLTDISMGNLNEEAATPWVINCTEKYKKQKKLKKLFTVPFSIFKEKNNDFFSIEINGFTYYKLSDDPNYLNY